ncbi:hypothetical protein Cpar_1105 [Chlorobaculum parvum NCIB 8327]|uniref:Uncharacterized protein n=1 Tax=Chlorobaculum parvum (strain DSM 263 / NCIMB 8327) TaxID=517417 RepID=B3QNK9_CHLP8|nr:hypothetical protein Cpar_1105 [Chlorobaculum parvum NCIB 8327]
MSNEGKRMNLEKGHIAPCNRRGPRRLLVSVAATLVVALLICLYWIYPFPPPVVVQYKGRDYRLGESWEEFQSRFPGKIEDPADLQRVAGGSLRFKAILDSPSPAIAVLDSTSTVICVQAQDGSYWAYSLVGGP